MSTDSIQIVGSNSYSKIELTSESNELAINFGKLCISSDCIAEKLFYQNLSGPSSLVPYKIIQYVSKNKLHDVIKHVVDIFYKDESCFVSAEEKRAVCGHEMFRNCTNTVRALSCIFLGYEATKKMMDHYSRDCPVTIEVSLPSGKLWEYRINTLFDGNTSHSISNNVNFDFMEDSQQIEILKTQIEECVEEFIGKMDSIIAAAKNKSNQTDEEVIEKIQKKFSDLYYPFNKMTIEDLQKDIFERNEKVSNNRSFIYVFFIKISGPDLEADRPIEHTCILEQFFLGGSQKVAFRLYQSWIGQATLSEEFVKRNYGCNGENYWNLDDLKNFLFNLDAYYCSDPREGVSITSRECYGYSTFQQPVLEFDGRTFFGKSFLYRIYEVEPEQCIKNFKLLNSSDHQ